MHPPFIRRFLSVLTRRFLRPSLLRILLPAAPVLLLLSGVGLCAPPALKTATFLPQWRPQAQFAGFYTAYDKGLYRKYGIDLTVLRGGPDRPAGAALAARQADFATLFLSEALQLRDKKVRLINIGQLMQRSGFLLVAKAGSGIAAPRDLQNRKVSLWTNFQVQPSAFFRKYGVAVKPIVQGETVNLFLRGGVDAASAMWYNEYYTLLNSGLNEEDLTTFFLDRHGLNFPEDGIYVLEETFRRDRTLCENFVLASLEGWRYAFDHPEEALDIVMGHVQKANVATNRPHQRWMLARMKDLIGPKDSAIPMGVLPQQDYLTVAKELHRAGLIGGVPSYGEFYAFGPPKP